MMQIFDVEGRSGAAYRFRRAASGAELPAHAGNFVVVDPAARPGIVLACGTCRSLVELSKPWPDLTTGGAEVYVRLNVNRAARLAEHDDLAARLAPVRLMREAD
jgi:hypothetical protein